MRLIIKELLASRRMGQNDLAQILGKSPAALSLQINGTPTLKSLSEIADALQVPISDLFEVPDNYVHWTQIKQHENKNYLCPNCGMEMKVIKKPTKEFSNRTHKIKKNL